jgi:type IV secretion system protein VirD4
MGIIYGVVHLSIKINWALCWLIYHSLKILAVLCSWLWKASVHLFGNDTKTLGSARFANKKELKQNGFYNGQGLLVGHSKEERLYAPTDDHALITAPTKSGKTTCFVITNLLKLGDTSAVVTDPNGECWAVTGRERSKHGQVHLWAPFSAITDKYNPLDYVRVGTPNERDDVELITSLIVPDSANSDDSFWNDQAREVIMGIILYVLYTRVEKKRTLAEVRHLLTLSEEAFDEVLIAMVHYGHPLITRAAHNLQNQESKLRSNVMATVNTKTRIWDSAILNAATSKSDFNFSELREVTGTVYLVVPLEHLANYYPALALISGVALAEINRARSTEPKRVTFMLDEFANLGRLKPFETAISIARKAGIQLCLFIQDLAQAKRVYGTGWESFEANCNTKIVFGINQIEEAKKLSDTLGVKTVKTRSNGHNHGVTDVMPNSINGGTGEASRPLMTADEIMAMSESHCIVLQKSMRPILATKMHYTHPHFAGLYDVWNGKPPYENIEVLHQNDTLQLIHHPILTLSDPKNIHSPASDVIELSDKQEAA